MIIRSEVWFEYAPSPEQRSDVLAESSEVVEMSEADMMASGLSLSEAILNRSPARNEHL